MEKIISVILAALMLFSAFYMNAVAQAEESAFDLCIITDAYIYLNGERSVKEFVEWLDNETAQLKKEDGGTLSANELIPTGATLEYIDGGDKKEYTFILPGDVNRDGKIQIKDARIVLRIAVGIEELKDFLTFMASNAYNNIESYEINIADAKALLRYSINIEAKDYLILRIAFQYYERPSLGISASLKPEYSNSDGTYSLDLFEGDLLAQILYDDANDTHLLILKNPSCDNVDLLIYSLQSNPCVYNVGYKTVFLDAYN